MQELTSGVKGLAMDNDLEKSETDRINIFHDFVKAKIDQGKDLGSVDREILTEAERLEVTNKATIVLCELIFDDAMLAQVKKNKKIFLRFCHGNQKAQKYLLGGVEKTLEQYKPTLLAKTASILKAFYDEDIIDEEVLLDWAKKVSKKYVGKELSAEIHKKAEPFIVWLKEAEEESSDEDDEDDLELEFDEKAKISSLKEKKENEENGKPVVNGKQNDENEEDEDDDEEDVDIDDL